MNQTLRRQAEIIDGQIVPLTGLEVIVSDHCNIACRQCNHGSPIIKKWNLDPEKLQKDLETLGEVFRPSFVKIIGGEPLLHPKLPEICRAVRAADIAPRVLVTTNGTLLNRMNPEVWQLIDEMEISWYPDAGLKKDFFEPFRARAKEHGVTFSLNAFPEFRRTFGRTPISDPDLVERVFKACKIANVWGCHTLYAGRLYRCPQSIYAHEMTDETVTEGIEISDRSSLRDDILQMITSPEPLAACRNCLGTSGKKEPHKILKRAEWQADLEQPLEDCIDYELLEENLVYGVRLDDCKTPEHRIFRSLRQKISRKLKIKPKRMRQARFKK